MSIAAAPPDEIASRAPLAEATFCVVDVETTGGSSEHGAITEIGAARFRGGRCLGTWSSLVDPGMPIPREITLLTGISAETVAGAPPARVALPKLLAFLDDAVLVGHNVRYDVSFLNAELRRAGLDTLTNQRLDTLALARRLVRDEVPNCKLATLSEQLQLAHQPSHRALDDVLATADLLHLLVERAATFGIDDLEELMALPRLAGHPQAGKLKLTESLPHAPGVYLFRDRRGNVLYVGKASDLKSRVRSYFSTDDRRKVGALLREVQVIDHETCRHPLEAAVREVQLIHELVPRYNDHATRWRKMAYLRLTDEDFPRFSVVRDPPTDAFVVLGPLASSSAAHRAAEAIADVVPLRRCARRVPKRRGDSGQLVLAMPGQDAAHPTPCTPAQLGVACCPCSGETSADRYAELVDRVRHGVEDEPALAARSARRAPGRARIPAAIRGGGRRAGSGGRAGRGAPSTPTTRCLATSREGRRRASRWRRRRAQPRAPGAFVGCR